MQTLNSKSQNNPPTLQETESFMQWLDRVCPPFMAYALAGLVSGPRNKRKWIGMHGIVERSGLSVRTVTRLGDSVSWESAKIGKVSRFLGACGIDPRNIKPVRDYLRHTMGSVKPFPHLGGFKYQVFQRRCALWIKRQTNK